VHRLGDGPYRPRDQIALRNERREKQCVALFLEKQLAGHSNARLGTEEHMIGHGSADFPAEHRSFRRVAHLQPDRRPT
jgi:hypothetical protein